MQNTRIAHHASRASGLDYRANANVESGISFGSRKGGGRVTSSGGRFERFCHEGFAIAAAGKTRMSGDNWIQLVPPPRCVQKYFQENTKYIKLTQTKYVTHVVDTSTHVEVQSYCSQRDCFVGWMLALKILNTYTPTHKRSRRAFRRRKLYRIRRDARARRRRRRAVARRKYGRVGPRKCHPSYPTARGPEQRVNFNFKNNASVDARKE